MSASDRTLIALIADEVRCVRLTLTSERLLTSACCQQDSTTGLLLAGIGNVDEKGEKNFLIVDNRVSIEAMLIGTHPILMLRTQQTSVADIEEAFTQFTAERKDIAILLINQHIAEKIRPIVDRYTQAFPALLEIPAKDHPYDPAKDSVLKRVQKVSALSHRPKSALWLMTFLLRIAQLFGE